MSKIFVTGDKHGAYDSLFEKMKTAECTNRDAVIILGDHGTLYYGPKDDRHKKNVVSKMPTTFIMLRGNHDRRPSCEGYNHRQIEINTPLYAGTFYIDQDFPNILYTSEYGWYRFGTKRVFVLCGAYSVDKFRRLKMQKMGFSSYHWFADEQLNSEEKACAEKTLADIGKNISFDIMSHTCPDHYKQMDTMLACVDQKLVDNSMEKWLGSIEQNYPYKHWYCGHWHTDRNVDRIHFLYNDLLLYDEVEDPNEGIS